jgi:AbrB family looped-hinge helix DNA binding protein
MEVTKITSKHQATVPAKVRAALGLRAGDAIEWMVGDDGVARVRKANRVDWPGAGVWAGSWRSTSASRSGRAPAVEPRAPAHVRVSRREAMEFEIGDDPQGLPEHPEGDRDGGLREHLFFRKEPNRSVTQLDEEAPGDQLGELA